MAKDSQMKIGVIHSHERGISLGWNECSGVKLYEGESALPDF